MGRFDEAETALGQALELEPDSEVAGANKAVLEACLGRQGKVESALMVEDLNAKREAFRAAMAKYTPQFEP